MLTQEQANLHFVQFEGQILKNWLGKYVLGCLGQADTALGQESDEVDLQMSCSASVQPKE